MIPLHLPNRNEENRCPECSRDSLTPYPPNHHRTGQLYCGVCAARVKRVDLTDE